MSERKHKKENIYYFIYTKFGQRKYFKLVENCLEAVGEDEREGLQCSKRKFWG